MNNVLSIPEVLRIADLSAPYSLNYNEEGALFGPRLNKTNALTILMVADALRWQYESGLVLGINSATGVANYLIWLCGKFGLQAQDTISHTPINSAEEVPPFGPACVQYSLSGPGRGGGSGTFSYVPCDQVTPTTVTLTDTSIVVSALINSVRLVSGTGTFHIV